MGCKLVTPNRCTNLANCLVGALSRWQQTPTGDVVIVTLEGDDPGHAFGQMMSSTDAFTAWFVERATAVHGIDPSEPTSSPPPELVVDTADVPAPVS